MISLPPPRSRRKARIELIPLIDIIFFLLATFVMVSLSMVRNRGVPVTLPVAATAAAQDLPEFVTLSISRDGAFYLDKELLPAGELAARLAGLREARGDDLRLLIRGDEEAHLGHAIAVLDECRRQGIAKVTFQTRQEAP